jgi:hypothetical protein
VLSNFHFLLSCDGAIVGNAKKLTSCFARHNLINTLFLASFAFSADAHHANPS